MTQAPSHIHHREGITEGNCWQTTRVLEIVYPNYSENTMNKCIHWGWGPLTSGSRIKWCARFTGSNMEKQEFTQLCQWYRVGLEVVQSPLEYEVILPPAIIQKSRLRLSQIIRLAYKSWVFINIINTEGFYWPSGIWAFWCLSAIISSLSLQWWGLETYS